MNAVWAAFWGELSTPSAYRDDPYGALANQAGHLALGAFMVSALCLVYAAIFGEMPYRWPVWAAIVTTYLLAVEWLQQGWNGPDSIVDTGFVSLGAAAPLASLKEVSFLPKIVLEPQPKEGLTVLVCIVVALAAYVYPRAVRKLRAGMQ